jgi:hypothetical protein
MVLSSSSVAEKANLDFAFVAVLPPLDPSPPAVEVIGDAVAVIHPPTDQLHVFKCLWLC